MIQHDREGSSRWGVQFACAWVCGAYVSSPFQTTGVESFASHSVCRWACKCSLFSILQPNVANSPYNNQMNWRIFSFSGTMAFLRCSNAQWTAVITHYYALYYNITLTIITYYYITLLIHHYYTLFHCNDYVLLHNHYYVFLHCHYKIITSL